MNASDILAIRAGDSALELLQVAASVQHHGAGQLQLLMDRVVAKLLSLDLDGAVRPATRRRRIQRLIGQLDGLIEPRIAFIGRRLAVQITGLPDLATDRFLTGYSAALPGLTPNVPTIDGQDLLNLPLVQGNTVMAHMDALARTIKLRLTGALNRAARQNMTAAEAVAEIRGRATSTTQSVLVNRRRRRVRVYAGGALKNIEADFASVIRTAILTGASEVDAQMAAVNGDAVKGYAAITILDSRTSDICLARTGSAWFLDGRPFPTSSTQEMFPGPPAWHFNCRSRLIVIFWSYDELLERATRRNRQALRDMTDEQRANLDGQLPDTITDAESFLASRDPELVKRQLGATKYRLWKSGQIRLSQLIDQSGRPRTVKDLLGRARRN